MRTTVLDRPAHSQLSGCFLAEVVSVADPEGMARVCVRLLSCDGVDNQDGPLWARVAVPYAGAGRGAFLLPSVGDEVLLTFVQGDARFPLVLGGLWNGGSAVPEKLGGAGDTVDRWTFVGKAGTRIAIVEEAAGAPTIAFSTPGGTSGRLTDRGGGEVALEVGSSQVVIQRERVQIKTGGKVEIEAATVEVKAGMVDVSAGVARFSGLVQCDTLVTQTVVATTYTPGAGNIW